MNFPTDGMEERAFFIAGTTKSIGSLENGAWAFQILPFVEQENLRQLRATHGWGTLFLKNQVPFFHCPTRGVRELLQPSTDVVPAGDYAGFISDGDSENSRPSTIPHPFFSYSDYKSHEEKYTWTGIISKGGHWKNGSDPKTPFKKFGEVGFSSIRDGSSNTILVAEKSIWGKNYLAKKHFTTSGGTAMTRTWDDQAYYYPAWTSMRAWSQGLLSDGQDRSVFPQIGDSEKENSFGSAHPGTLSTVLGDGSTHAISMDTERLTFDRLGNRNDGHAASISDAN